MAVAKKEAAPKPYEHQDFPAMLYRGSADGSVSNMVVHSQEEKDAKLKDGWVEHPDEVGGGGAAEGGSVEALTARIDQLERENAALIKALGEKKAAKALEGVRPATDEG